MSLIALHGFLGHPNDWHPVLAPANEASAGPEDWLREKRIWTPSLWAMSSADSFEAWTELFVELLAHEQLPSPTILLGYSLGGRLALHAAMRAPERFSGVVLISTHPGLLEGREQHERLLSDLSWAETLQTIPWREWVARWNQQPVMQTSQPHPSAADEAFWSKKALAAALCNWSVGKQKLQLSDYNLRELPLLLVHGANDPNCQRSIPALFEQLSEKGICCESLTIPRAGHRLLIDAPALLRTALLRWINQQNL